MDKEGLMHSSQNNIFNLLDQLLVRFEQCNMFTHQSVHIGVQLLQECARQDKLDVKIDKSGANEVSFLRQHGKQYSILLLDHENDIKFMYIGTKIVPTQSHVYYFEDGFDYQEIVQRL